MEKRGFCIVLLLIVLFSSFISIVLAEDFCLPDEKCITRSSRPSIQLFFQEPVRVLDILMVNTEDTTIKYKMSDFSIAYSANKTNLTVTPLTSLDNGLYIFTIKVEDLVHNRILYNRNIDVDVPQTKVIMLRPRLQVMNATVGDIILNTRDPITDADKYAYCKYARTMGAQSRVEKFRYSYEFDSSNSSTHILKNFDFSKPENRFIFVLCKDKDEKITTVPFTLGYDLIPPVIKNVTFTPPMMITLDNVFNVTVETNEQTYCYFSLLGKKYYFNSKTDEYDVNSYLLTHTIKMDKILPDGNGRYDFDITCHDQAFWNAATRATYTVDLTQALDILVKSPAKFVSTKEFTLDFFTNKQSYCEYSFGNSGLKNTTSRDNPVTHHAPSAKYNANVGKNTIHFECISESAGSSQMKLYDYQFTYDNTAPSMPVISGKNNTCVLNSISVTAESKDNESEIDYYMYMVESLGKKLLVNWTKNTGSKIDFTNKNLNMTSNTDTYIYVTATNKAGLKSLAASKRIHYDATGISCDSIPPKVRMNRSLAFGRTFISLNCTDNSGRCFLSYNLVTSGQCVPTSPYTGPRAIDANSILCYLAKDPAGNNVSGTVNVSVYANPDNSKHCSNSIFEPDLGESDLDCGGNCFPCGEGRTCTKNTDCLSKRCDEVEGGKICVKAECDDNLTDGTETDLDCGGEYCAGFNLLCVSGKSCFINRDCVSGYCENNKCANVSCTDKTENGNESDTDCGGSCDACDLGGKCRIDADCSSNYCNNGKCTDYKEKDCDNDGLPDYWEKRYFRCDATDGCMACADPRDDIDSDGLRNIDEFRKGTDPTKPDTDGDKYSDKIELDSGFDPLNSEDHPSNWTLYFLILLLFMVLIFFIGAYQFDYFKPIRDESHIKYLTKKKAEEEERKKQEERDRLIKARSMKQEMPVHGLHPQQNAAVQKKPALHVSKIDTTREKERGKIFDAFDNGTKKTGSEEFRRRIAEKLRQRRLGKSGRSGSLSLSGSSSGSSAGSSAVLKRGTTVKPIPASAQGSTQGSAQGTSRKVSDDDVKRLQGDPLDKILVKDDDFSKMMEKLSSHKTVTDETISAVDKLSKLTEKAIEKRYDSIDDDLLNHLQKKTEDKFDRLVNSKNYNPNKEFADLDMISSRKNPAAEGKSRDERKTMESPSPELQQSISRINLKKNLSESFAQSLSSGMNLKVFALILKKLLDDGKVNKDDIRELMLDLKDQGKISQADHQSILKDMGL